MRIVVAGGTGFVGRAIVAELLSRGGHEIVVTTRNPARDPWGGRVRLAQAFAGDPLTLGRAFTNADVVVHCIQFPNHPVEDPKRGRTYVEVDGQGTERAARIARQLGVRRFVYLSGAGAGQGRPQPWFRAKDMAESAIRNSGMEYALLRPSWIYGPGDRSLNRIVSFCRHLPVVPVIGNGKSTVWPLYVKDAARAAVECVVRDDSRNRMLELGGPQRLTMNEVVRIVQQVLHRRRPLLHQPKWLMKLVSRPMALLPTPPLSPGAVDFITQEVEIDPGPTYQYLGFPFRPLEEGLQETLRARQPAIL